MRIPFLPYDQTGDLGVREKYQYNYIIRFRRQLWDLRCVLVCLKNQLFLLFDVAVKSQNDIHSLGLFRFEH